METAPARSSRRGACNSGSLRHGRHHARPIPSNSLPSSSTHGGCMRCGQVPAPTVGGNRGWKVKGRLKLAHRRHLGQDPASTVRSGWKVKRRLKLARRPLYIDGGYASSEAVVQKIIPTPPLMQFMKYVPPLLFALAILKYQAKAQIMFREKPVALWSFIAATSVYWLIVGVMKMPSLGGKLFQILRNAAVASAILSTISLASIFLPYPGSLLPVAVSISFTAALALIYAFILFVKGIEYIIYKIHGVFVWARGCNLMGGAAPPA